MCIIRLSCVSTMRGVGLESVRFMSDTEYNERVCLQVHIMFDAFCVTRIKQVGHTSLARLYILVVYM